ncbi:hypothetical protein GW17_00013173 [Ensete ventricosum]|nr:hypothetical protein GW17_00013173 [Ensete ventricosum]
MAKGLGIGCTKDFTHKVASLGSLYDVLYNTNANLSLGQSFSNLGAFSKGKAAGYKLLEIIRQKPSIIQDQSDGKCLGEVHGNIEFKDVTFSYPSRPDVIIFRDFSLFFPAGKTVAVVGGSGSGKSTVVALIERFYDPNQERGVQLSGGQKQRIAIARAMLKNPKILLLDEATSALDAGSESIVQEALDRLMVGRTTVVVAHRLSTIRNVDMVAVIQQGQVVETGTHEDLLAKGSSGAYASLIRFQEMARNRDFGGPSTRRSRSSRLSHSLSTKSLSLRSGSLRNLSYQYSTGADGRIEMVSNADNVRKYPAPRGYFFKLLKLNAPEWPYTIMGAIGSVLSGFIGPTFAIVMSNMIEVFYYRDPDAMERKTREYVFIYIGTGLYAVVAYLVQHYFFSIMGENLTTRHLTVVSCQCHHQQLSLKGFAGDTAKAHAKTSMIAGEGVSNIRTVAAFNAQDKILSLFCNELRIPQRRSFRRSQTSGILYGLSQLSLYTSEALILWYGAHLVRSGASTFSKVIKVFVVLVVTANSVAETVSLAPEIVRGGESIRSVFAILNRGTRIEPDDPEAEHVDSVRGEIELRHVDFAYPSRPDVPIFKDFNLRIRAGQSQALVGASGSGKSTVIALIERFYDPTAGKVLIDGRDIKRLNLKSLRLKIGLVQQEPVLFAASIMENIAYGKDGATEEEEVIEAARAANVHGFVSGLPDGYRTAVGERGVQLSGGQKQRIAIARAVLKDPAVLLLDEATSALDAESECVLQEALERLMKGRTTVLVAHRLSTIRGVDHIGVVQEGRIVEQGSHSDLVARPDGAYSRLLQLQHYLPCLTTERNGTAPST